MNWAKNRLSKCAFRIVTTTGQGYDVFTNQERSYEQSSQAMNAKVVPREGQGCTMYRMQVRVIRMCYMQVKVVQVCHMQVKIVQCVTCRSRL